MLMDSHCVTEALSLMVSIVYVIIASGLLIILVATLDRGIDKLGFITLTRNTRR